MAKLKTPIWSWKMGISGLYNDCFGKKKCSHSFALFLVKLDMDDRRLLAKDERCATSGSKVMTEP